MNVSRIASSCPSNRKTGQPVNQTSLCFRLHPSAAERPHNGPEIKGNVLHKFLSLTDGKSRHTLCFVGGFGGGGDLHMNILHVLFFIHLDDGLTETPRRNSALNQLQPTRCNREFNECLQTAVFPPQGTGYQYLVNATCIFKIYIRNSAHRTLTQALRNAYRTEPRGHYGMRYVRTLGDDGGIAR